MKTKSQEAYEKYLKIIEIVKDDDIAINLLNHLINKICEIYKLSAKKSKQEKEESQKALDKKKERDAPLFFLEFVGNSDISRIISSV